VGGGWRCGDDVNFGGRGVEGVSFLGVSSFFVYFVPESLV